MTNLTELLTLNAYCRFINEVTLVRMSNDATMEPAKRRNYTGVGNAFSRILREEGVKTFFTGSVADQSDHLKHSANAPADNPLNYALSLSTI